MISEKLIILVFKIHTKSTRGELDWKESSSQDEYVVAFPDFSISVSKFEPSNTPFQVISGAATRIDIKFYDENGKKIDSISSNEIPENSDLNQLDFTEIFDSAKRRAMGVDQKLDHMLTALSS